MLLKSRSWPAMNRKTSAHKLLAIAFISYCLRCCRELSAAASSKARGKKDKRKDRKKAALAELTRQVSGEAGLVRDNDDD